MSIAELPPESAQTAASPHRNRRLAIDRRTARRRTVPPAERVPVLETIGDGVRLLSYRLGFAGIDDPKATAWQVLGYKEFRRYFVGSVVSNFGTWLQNTAQVLLAYQLGRSIFFVGLVTCAQFLSPLLLGPSAGALAGRWGTKRTLLSTQVMSAAISTVLASLWFTHALSETALLAGAFLGGLMFTLALPAQSVIIPALVPSAETDTKAAVVMNSVSYNAGRSVAPAIGVLVASTIGFGWAFALNALSFMVFVAVLRGLPTSSSLPKRARSRVWSGIRVAWSDQKIMILLLIVAAVTVAEDPLLVLGPALAGHVAGADDWSGFFLSAMGGGSILGSLVPRRKAPSIRRTATALGLLGVFIIVFALSPWMWLSIAAAFAAGTAGLVTGSAAQAKLRELAGSQRALQIMGLWTVAWAGSKPIASLIDGALPGLVGLRVTGLIMALPALVPMAVLVTPRTEKRFSRGASRASVTATADLASETAVP